MNFTYIKCHCRDGYHVEYITHVQVDEVPTSLLHIHCCSWKNNSIAKWLVQNLLHIDSVTEKFALVICSNVRVYKGTLNFSIFERCTNFFKIFIVLFCEKNNKKIFFALSILKFLFEGLLTGYFNS